jgi:hypothetical protein
MPGTLLGRGAPEHAGTIGYVVMEPSASTDEGALSDSQMSRRTGLGHHDRPPADDRPAGKTRLGDDQSVFANITVVSDLDQIVDLCTPPYARLVEGRPIDGGIRADFDIILDDDATTLSHRDGTTGFVRCVPETIRAENDPGLQYDTIPDSSAFTQDRAGVDPTITAEFDIHDERRIRCDDTTSTYTTSPPDDGTGFDRCSRIDDRARVNVCADRDAQRWTRDRSEFSNQSGKVMCGMKTAKGRSTVDLDARRYDERPGLALLESSCVCGIAKKNQLIGPGLTQGCEAGDLEILVPFDGTSQHCRQLGQSNRPERPRH